MEHDVGCRYSSEPAEDLGADVRGHLSPWQLAKKAAGQADEWVQVGAGDRAEHEDVHGEPGSGCQRIGQQRQGDVPGSQALAHDPGAHDGRQEKPRSYSLGGAALREGIAHHQALSRAGRKSLS